MGSYLYVNDWETNNKEVSFQLINILRHTLPKKLGLNDSIFILTPQELSACCIYAHDRVIRNEYFIRDSEDNIILVNSESDSFDLNKYDIIKEIYEKLSYMLCCAVFKYDIYYDNEATFICKWV